ncbi:hypothetical protein TcWFU_004855 [Taenia crassiceps]|uniref:Uncharacterized protein n=1 Tax=Taenia crassiceps TaxID=6207 RepID=A0ABR4QKZ6_9CEST
MHAALLRNFPKLMSGVLAAFYELRNRRMVDGCWRKSKEAGRFTRNRILRASVHFLLNWAIDLLPLPTPSRFPQWPPHRSSRRPHSPCRILHSSGIGRCLRDDSIRIQSAVSINFKQYRFFHLSNYRALHKRGFGKFKAFYQVRQPPRQFVLLCNNSPTGLGRLMCNRGRSFGADKPDAVQRNFA